MIFKSVKDVAEVYETIFLREKEPINHSFLLTGGAVKTEIQGKDNVEFYAQYVREIKKRLGNRWDCHAQTTALTKEECVRLKDAGVDAHHGNIEVWDERLFKIICPAREVYRS